MTRSRRTGSRPCDARTIVRLTVAVCIASAGAVFALHAAALKPRTGLSKALRAFDGGLMATEPPLGSCRAHCSSGLGPTIIGEQTEPDGSRASPMESTPNGASRLDAGAVPALAALAQQSRQQAHVDYEPGLRHDAIVALANDRGPVCTGTLIAPTLVLTARHCLPLRDARFGPDPTSPLASMRVVATHVPPLGTVDVALLELDSPAPVKPLRTRATEDRDPPRGFIRLAGFGATNAGGTTGMSRLHFVDVPIRDWGCNRSNEGRTGCTATFEMIVPRDGGNDTCAGDSGGPVLEEFGGGLRVVGVTSRTIKNALLRCGDGGIYTRLDAVRAWMDRVRSNVSEEKR